MKGPSSRVHSTAGWASMPASLSIAVSIRLRVVLLAEPSFNALDAELPERVIFSFHFTRDLNSLMMAFIFSVRSVMSYIPASCISFLRGFFFITSPKSSSLSSCLSISSQLTARMVPSLMQANTCLETHIARHCILWTWLPHGKSCSLFSC